MHFFPFNLLISSITSFSVNGVANIELLLALWQVVWESVFYLGNFSDSCWPTLLLSMVLMQHWNANKQIDMQFWNAVWGFLVWMKISYQAHNWRGSVDTTAEGGGTNDLYTTRHWYMRWSVQLSLQKPSLQTTVQLGIRGERERSPPLTKITHPSHPHLGRSQASAQPECNGRASPWGHRLLDHGSPCAR